ncbi:MAG: hypothetical protein U1D30_23720 [Planctomycetota bacterium]
MKTAPAVRISVLLFAALMGNISAPRVVAQEPTQALPEIRVEAERTPATPEQAPQPGQQDALSQIPEEAFVSQFGQNDSGQSYSGVRVDGSIPWNSNVITRDSDRVGPYGQPVWTTQRPFAASRVYVLPPGQAQVEQWVRPTWGREGKPEYRMLEEIAIGLPGRFQLDIYERWNIKENDLNGQEANHEGVQIELRWALADWNRIFLNPTFYAEWVERGNGNPDVYELKLLLAQEFTPKLFYASNLILEQEVGGEGNGTWLESCIGHSLD